MNYKKAWITLGDIIAKEASRKYAMLGQRDGVFEAANPSIILGQIEMLHFIRVIMGSIEDYTRGCDEECCDTVDRKEHEEG
jgi:hypothetical protein